jgi:hypothetical protein
MDGVLFKIDFEKARDKIKWSFLQQVLCMKGFDPIWCERIKQNMLKGGVWEFGLMMMLAIISKLEKD